MEGLDFTLHMNHSYLYSGIITDFHILSNIQTSLEFYTNVVARAFSQILETDHLLHPLLLGQ